VRFSGGCGRWFLTLIWVVEDKDLLWRRCGTVEIAIQYGSIGFLWCGVVTGCPICRWWGEDEIG